MAAMFQTHVGNFERKVKPYLREGPYASHWDFVEQKAKVKREQVALGLVGIVALYLAFGWGNDFLCDIIGFVYPAYASVLAIESRAGGDDTEWLTYWVVYATFGIIEYVGHSFFHSLPLYWLGKCIFLIWLMMPGANSGSQIIYNKLLRPLLIRNRSTAERVSAKVSEKVDTSVGDYTTRYTN